MKLEYLVLKNYRKFPALELKFTSGVTAIIGRNGSGKSTLMEAVAWALYGNEAAIVRVNKESIKNVRAGPKDPVLVELGFIFEGQRYVVTREMRGTTLTTKARVTCQDSPAAEGAKEVNQYLNKLLGLDYQGFFSSVFAKQKELKALSDEDPAERRKLIIRMLGIDAIEKALHEVRIEFRGGRSLLEERRKGLKDEDGAPLVEVRQRELEMKVGEKEEKLRFLARMKDELEIYERKVKAAKDEYKDSQKRRDDYHELQSRMEQKRRMRALYQDQVEQLDNSIEQLERAKEELNELEKKIIHLSSLEEELMIQEKAREIERTRNNHEKRKTELESNRKKLAYELKDLSIDKSREETIAGELKQLDAAYDRERSEKEKLAKEMAVELQSLSRLERKIGKYKSRLNEISVLPETSICPTCERPLNEAHPLLMEKYSHKIEKGKEERESGLARKIEIEIIAKAKEEEMAGLIKNRERFNVELKDFQKKRECQSVLLERMKNINEDIKRINREVDDLGPRVFDHRTYGELRSKVDKLRASKQKALHMEGQVSGLPAQLEKRESKMEKRDQIEDDISLIKERLKEITFREKDHQDLERTVEELTRRFIDLKGVTGKTEEEIKFRMKDLERLKKEIVRLRKLEEDVTQLEDKTQYLSRLAHLMNEFWNSLISRIRPILSSIASGYLAQLTGSRYSQMEIVKNYDIWIYDGNVKYPINRFSGGEEDLANLCLRLAISSIIAASKRKQGLKFIVLDEIFGSQDQERRRNILTAIAQLLKRFQQVFIITHIDQVKETIGNVILVKEEVGGNSTAELLTD